MCHLKYQVGPLQQGSCIHHWHLELPLPCSDSSTVSQTFQIIFSKCPSSAHPQPFHSVTHPGKVLQRWCCKQELWQDSGHGSECFEPNGSVTGTTASSPNVLYITYISMTAHEVSPYSKGKSIPPGPGLSPQCPALNKCA